MASHPYLSLASGIGGLDLGVERGSGGTARAVCYVEAEISAAAVLAARMEEGALFDAPVWSDIRTFDARLWRGKVAGVVAGYPCQPFSTDGRRQGHEDRRNLWPDVLRVIRESGAWWCFLENVEGHLSMGYFDRVKPDLEAAGFRCEEQIVRALDVGLPHQRKRLFILAVADDSGAMGARRGVPGLDFRELGTEVRGSGGVGCCPPRIPGPAENQEWRALAESHPHLIPARQPYLRRGAHGDPARLDIPDGVRLSLLGNAVVPDQAALAWRLLWDEMEGR